MPPLNWTDRRPIGTFNVASTECSTATNPRGWFNDTQADYTTTAAGRAAFRSKLLAVADVSIRELQRVNAQGMVFWDMEGCQYPHGSGTYIGDPILAEILAPENIGVLDLFFKKFRDAGLRTGCTLRPQVFNLRTRQQEFSADPVGVLTAKAWYAKLRWSCSLFYCDSTVAENYPGSGPNQVHNLDASVMKQLHANVPGALFIFENEVDGDYQYGSAYGQLNQMYLGAPANVNGFGVIYVPDANIYGYYDDLVSAVKKGNILMFRSWFQDDPINQSVIDIYKTAALK